MHFFDGELKPPTRISGFEMECHRDYFTPFHVKKESTQDKPVQILAFIFSALLWDVTVFRMTSLKRWKAGNSLFNVCTTQLERLLSFESLQPQYVSLVGTAAILQPFQKPGEIYNDHWGIKVTTFKNIFKEQLLPACWWSLGWLCKVMKRSIHRLFQSWVAPCPENTQAELIWWRWTASCWNKIIPMGSLITFFF